MRQVLAQQLLGGEPGHVVAVVEDQQARQRRGPRLVHAGHLLGKRQARRVGVQLQRACAATGGDLGSHASGVGERDPEDAAEEKLAVAMHKFGGELGFARAANAGGDGSGAPGFERGGDGSKLVRAANKARIVAQGHAVRRRQRRRRGNLLFWQFGQPGHSAGSQVGAAARWRLVVARRIVYVHTRRAQLSLDLGNRGARLGDRMVDLGGTWPAPNLARCSRCCASVWRCAASCASRSSCISYTYVWRR